jgi:two-component system, OmpR family, response regulator
VIVEDDLELQALLERGLTEEGFSARAVTTGAELLENVVDLAPDALVVDIGLPDADGRDVCQALRSRGIRAPVLFLTARDSIAERVSGFDAGGDDYVTKPFAFAELVARLQALLRRGGGDGAVEGGGLRLDPVRHAVAVGERAVALTPTEFRVLARLLARSGEVVRRRELVHAAWPAGAIVHDNTLDAYISRLRRKLRELGADAAIRTAHGVGYTVE